MNPTDTTLMMQSYVLDHNKLQAGDVILSSERTLRSKGIRITTKSDFSHAMICVGLASYVHAHGPGVEIANPQRELFDAPTRIKVLRYVGPDRERVIYEACAFVRKRVGTQYSVPEALATKLPRARRNLSNRQFCSRLVAQAYAAGGVDLVADADYCSPHELQASPLLTAVPGCVRLAVEAEVVFANEADQPLSKQAAIIGALLRAARKITGEDLQSIPQIEAHLLADAEHDVLLSKALVESGYLSMWKMDVNRNRWRYDETQFCQLSISPQQMLDVAQQEVRLAMEDILRFKQARNEVTTWIEVADRKFFRLERELYDLLIELHGRRYAAAKAGFALAMVSGGGQSAHAPSC